jgi:hypothetical protein
MTLDGFLPAGCEGRLPQGGAWNDLPSTFEIGGVRPDAWAQHPVSHQIAIGEAKTTDDVATRHTVDQLRVFGQVLQKSRHALCRLYIAVPRAAAYDLDVALSRARLIGKRNIVRLHIPDCLLTGTEGLHA